MKIKSYYLLFLGLFFLCSCATSTNLAKFYHPYFSNEESIAEECLLQEGEEPKVYYSDNINDDITLLRSRYYTSIGDCSYNGPDDSTLVQTIKKFCKEKRAKIAIYSYNYTHTNYGVYNTGQYISSYNVRRYDYTIVFFAKQKDSYIENQITGFLVKDLDTTTRKEYQRNTGVLVDVVYENSNAFYANLIKNDIITRIKYDTIDMEIKNSEDFDVINNYFKRGNTITLFIIRNGYEHQIKYEL